MKNRLQEPFPEKFHFWHLFFSFFVDFGVPWGSPKNPLGRSNKNWAVFFAPKMLKNGVPEKKALPLGGSWAPFGVPKAPGIDFGVNLGSILVSFSFDLHTKVGTFKFCFYSLQLQGLIQICCNFDSKKE